ncbi:MAG: orotate phosphoribosyltransferase [Thermoflavifilum sp.]|nr:orotate phosphoribosyltransferase [Thermoflavifilum sp.]
MAHQVAEKLLYINAVKLNPEQPFTWASGWKSPIYCDNRRILSFPYIRDYIKSELSNLIDRQFPDVEVIAGVATAGIAHGVLAADLLKLNFVYVRSGPKDHGLGNQIEGIFTSGQKIVVVEDLISTGSSSLRACEALQQAGGEVMGVVALFDYGFEIAREAFQRAGIPVFALSHYDALLEVALDKGVILGAQLPVLQQWRLSPQTWQPTS